MAGTITAIQVQKKNKQRVNIYLDGDYAFPLPMSVALSLRKGQTLSDSEIEQLKQENERHQAYSRAIRYLGYRARSQAEMETYLQKKEYPPEIIMETVDRLSREGYLDDDDFARLWVEDRKRLRPRGRRALRYELRQKGLDRSTIESALAEVDDRALAWEAIRKKLSSWRRLDEESFRKKALGFLGRRGFNYEVAREAIDRAWQELAADN